MTHKPDQIMQLVVCFGSFATPLLWPQGARSPQGQKADLIPML